MTDPVAAPIAEQTSIAEQPIADAAVRGRCPTCGRRVRGFVDADSNFTPVKTKSGIQKRLDQLTRQRYEALRQAEAVRDEALAKLKRAEHLLGQYKDELEKYRAKFVELAVKEKQHGR